jgi:RNA polymerase sigma-70 factor (ECF subfamily)
MTLLATVIDPPSPPCWAAEPTPAPYLAYELGKLSWPQLILSYEAFKAYAERIGDAQGHLQTYAADIYLCAACGARDTAAYRALEATFFPSLRTLAFRQLGERPAVEDVLQEVRTRLLAGDSPKLASYQGRGPLAGWLRSVVLHAAKDHRRRSNLRCLRTRQLAAAEGADAAPATDDQLSHRDRACLCEKAWQQALRSLSPGDRQLLHHHFVSGLSIDVLGPLYSVHRATIARRIRRATLRVGGFFRRALADHDRELSNRELYALALSTARELDMSGMLRRDIEPQHAA